MTHKQLWMTIAEAYGTSVNERTDGQFNIAYDGLCEAVIRVIRGSYNYSLSLQFFDYFLRKIYSGSNSSQWYRMRGQVGFSNEYDELRMLHALSFAAMTRKEFEDMCGHTYKELGLEVK